MWVSWLFAQWVQLEQHIQWLELIARCNLVVMALVSVSAVFVPALAVDTGCNQQQVLGCEDK